MNHQRPLGEISKLIRGISFPKESKSLEPRPGDVACLRTANVQREVEWGDLWFVPVENVKRQEQYVQPGDILISTANSYELVGKVAFVNSLPQQSTLGAFISLIRPSDEVEPKFLYHQLAWGKTQERIRETASTTTNISNVSTKKLAGLELLLPTLDEQQRIVAEIEKQFSRLDEAAANLKRVKANLKRYKAAVLKAAVEGKLTEVWRKQHPDTKPASELLQRILAERRAKWEQAELAKMQSKGKAPKDDAWKKKYPEPTGLDTTDLPELPMGWVWATLDMIGQEGRPIIYGIIKPGPHVPDGVPYVRVTEMKDGRIDVEGLRRAAPERAAKFARATLQPGDILISKDGTIGRVAVVPPELAGGNITQHVMRAPVHEWVWRDYVVLAIRSDWCQRWLTGETKGVALRGVNVEDFRRLPIPIPPVAEQISIDEEVERCLSITDEAEAQVNANLQRAERLRQSILATAFTPPVKEFAEPTHYANREQRVES